ncbi:MAG: helix-turn-helix domain-containing protein [Streptosporangiaceae bacterium]
MSGDSGPTEYLKVRQVAAKLGLGLRAVYELIASGELESVKVGTVLRVSPDAIDAYMASQPTKEDLCEIGEVARMLQVSRRTIAELIADGCLKAVKIRGCRSQMVFRESLDAYLNGPAADRPGRR